MTSHPLSQTRRRQRPSSPWMAIGKRCTVMCLSPRGPVGKLGGKILGCRELVVLHDQEGHPLLVTTHRGDQHLTIGAPQVVRRDEQGTDKAHLEWVVVDREGLSAE